MMNGSQARRPRPRARDTVSVEADLGAFNDDSDLFTQNIKVVRSPDKKSIKRVGSLGKSVAGAGDKAFFNDFELDTHADIPEEEDDDEFLFDRTRSRKGANLLVDPVDLTVPFPSSTVGDVEVDEVFAGDDTDDSDYVHNKKSNPWGRGKKRTYRSEWSRSDSKTAVVARQKARRNSLDSETSGDEAEDTTLTSPMAGDVNGDVRVGRKGKGRAKARDRGRSGSVTPPPEIEQRKLVEVAQMVKIVLDRTGCTLAEDDDEDTVDAILNDKDVMAELDPDLRRAMKGHGAAELRRQMRESDALRQEQLARAQRSMSRQTASTNATAASLSSCNAIEISDSDGDERPPVRVFSSTAKSRNTRNSARARGSSSPPVFVALNVAAPVAASSQARGPPEPRQNQPKATAVQVSSSPSAESYSTTRESAEQDRWRAQEHIPSQAASQQAEEEEEEEDRIQLVMKGGEGGSLQVQVRVRQSTLIEKLLDHFIKIHRESIPLNRTSKVRIRFDGDILNSKATVGEVGIEDEEQLDVIW